MKIQEFYDQDTNTLTYVVYDESSRDALVIDPVFDYDPASSKLSERSVTALTSWINGAGLKIHFSLETHAHADHISAAQIIKRSYPGCRIAIGERIREVQEVFREIFALPKAFAADGSQFDLLLQDEQEFSAGTLKVRTIFTPGHTPACVSYLIGDALFVGDTLFMPDYGTGRCDFPAGSADALFESIHRRLYQLPNSTRVFTGHDYQPGGRPLKFCSTIAEQKSTNTQLQEKTAKEDFVKFRTARDKTLSAPRLLLPSVQINIDAGHIPKADDQGRAFLRIPLFH